MTVYPMLNTERARIVNEAVAVACIETGFGCDYPLDTLRWWDISDLYTSRINRGTP